jgi:pimeloyl-ACP methyl ester carboxylesterase
MEAWMTVVLVHGVPETAAVWDSFVDELARLGETDVVRLSPPGFGAPVPDGFDPSMEGYLAWLVGELETIGEPVDLFGHDWGGGHVLNVAMTRPDLVRTWASDILGVFDTDYVWHDMAQQWQTPEVGESVVTMLAETPLADRAAFLMAAGMAGEIAERVAPGVDAEMGRCILTLYRSAAQPVVAERSAAHLGKAAARPGLALLPTEDTYVGTEAQRRRAADRAGARVAVFDGLGHWWMTEDPAATAGVAVEFWREHR